MARFEARVLSRGGVKTLTVEAPTQKDAEKIAQRNGRVTSLTRKVGFDLSSGMSRGERYTWMVRMSSLIGSKLGTAQALNLMKTTFSGTIRRASAQMLDRIESGMSLPEAMSQDRKNFPAATAALVTAGAATGETWRALKDAADFEYKMSNAHKGSMRQIWSAIGSFVLAAAMMIGTTRYFGPMVMDNPMFKTAKGVNVEWARLGGDICTWTMIVLLVIFGLFFWLGTMGRQMMPNLADRLIQKIPYYKDLILARNNHVTFYRLSLLIQSGVRVEEALKLTEQASPRGALKNDLGKAIAAVKGGKAWAKSMHTLHETDRAALSVSTDRVDIARTLDLLATQYSDLYIQRISTFAPALSAVGAVFMTLAGGVLFAQTILPMLQLSTSY